MHLATEHPDRTFEFFAMGSPCAVIVDSDDDQLAAQIGAVVIDEAKRVEAKFSRYRPSVITTINETAGEPIELDAESADLIDYAHRCHLLSDGLFDITSGVLRRVWRFDGSGQCPNSYAIAEVMHLVGWHRVDWTRPFLTLKYGMEIDLGGIGKEYAVDRAMSLATQLGQTPILINFGGDLRVSGLRKDGTEWRVAIEHVDHPGKHSALLALARGAIATSGDAHRFVLHEGRRLGHVLNPKTGWPIEGAPRSVTVLADSCSEAGLLAKLALLKGEGAEQFLKSEEVRAWVTR